MSAPSAAAPPSLWVFVSTIGELNAIEPLLQRLLEELQQPPLTLLSDRPVYADAYRARYPQASVVFMTGTSSEASALVKASRPLMLVVAEIPALLHDAPCRLSFAMLHAAHCAGAPVVLVNGWGYGYMPPSRMDAIESSLFAADYVQSFDLLLVQTEAFGRQLVAQGAAANRVVVVGNLKFDAMDKSVWQLEDTRSPHLLGCLLASGRHVIVAGCVSDAEEEQRVLDAFTKLRSHDPGCLLVLAPRHPENAAGMQRLRTLLDGLQLGCVFRSTLADEPVSELSSVLVLDTMGELRDFYAAAGVAHVGKDHNVLEPMGFGKPVTVSPDWDRTYPSFPVYELMRQQGALLMAADAVALARQWAQCFELGSSAGTASERSRLALTQARGATQRHLDALQPFIERMRAEVA